MFYLFPSLIKSILSLILTKFAFKLQVNGCILSLRIHVLFLCQFCIKEAAWLQLFSHSYTFVQVRSQQSFNMKFFCYAFIGIAIIQTVNIETAKNKQLTDFVAKECTFYNYYVFFFIIQFFCILVRESQLFICNNSCHWAEYSRHNFYT